MSLHTERPDCTFCENPNPSIYKDGREADAVAGPFACGNHTKRLNDPRCFDPISPEMARHLHEMQAEADAAQERAIAADDGLY